MRNRTNPDFIAPGPRKIASFNFYIWP